MDRGGREGEKGDKKREIWTGSGREGAEKG